jgi:hypothetical protein
MKLRTQFELILKKWGHNIMLQRVRDPHQGERIYLPNLEIHTVRHRLSGSNLITNIAQEQPEGVAYDVDEIYYFKWDANPMSGDRIYENIERYPRELNTFLVDFAQPMRGKNGQIVYWLVGTTRETP